MHIQKEYSIETGGKNVTAQFTDLADQTNGSVILKSEGTVVMATAVMGRDTSNNPGYFNLTVEYLEKFYASGRILGSRFQRREGRPTDEAVLSGRVIDRTLRPLFDQRMKNAVQVIITVLALGDADPGILGINAASLAVATSDIPWGGPVAAVHVGKKRGEEGPFSTNLYLRESDELAMGEYEIDLTVCGRAGTVNMIEAMTRELSEESMGEALDLAMEEITKIETWQNNIVSEIGKEKQVIEFPETPAALVAFFETHGREPLWNALMKGVSKKEFYAVENAFFDKLRESFHEKSEENETLWKAAGGYYHHMEDIMIHELALKETKRADGRDFGKVRALHAQAGGISPVLHGSGIFYRGETHVLSVLTLAGPDESKIEEGMEVQTKRRFMHHYNFPPYSVGEAGRMGSTGRREIGHGALVEKALTPVLPEKSVFPYTIRVVSESTASNGSTSQASICASTLALMDGGVPITKPVAGIAMGLMMEQGAKPREASYKILTDIQGPEDHHGDMDFKVAGTRDGITAIQLDIKVDGVPVKVLKEALGEARAARLHILETLATEIAAPRADISTSAPKILSHKIDVSQIGLVIGKGGETIQKIQEQSGAQISIEDDGVVYFVGKGGSAERALDAVKALTKEWQPGEQAEAEIIKILEGVGAIAKISTHADGLIHVSQIANFRIEKVEDYLSVGMKVPVTITEVDKAKGRISLSIKKDHPDLIKQKP